MGEGRYVVVLLSLEFSESPKGFCGDAGDFHGV